MVADQCFVGPAPVTSTSARMPPDELAVSGRRLYRLKRSPHYSYERAVTAARCYGGFRLNTRQGYMTQLGSAASRHDAKPPAGFSNTATTQSLDGGNVSNRAASE